MLLQFIIYLFVLLWYLRFGDLGAVLQGHAILTPGRPTFRKLRIHNLTYYISVGRARNL
jgi:hypothetical protein